MNSGGNTVNAVPSVRNLRRDIFVGDKMKKRILLVSDMHYTTQETHDELEKIHPGANTCPAAGTILGMTQQQKLDKLMSDILEEHKKEPLDMILVLGDLSVDDYDFRKLPDNYCRKFKEEVMDKLPSPIYALPGNHDSHSEEVWQEIFGYPREYSIKLGDSVFLMLDTFNNLPAKGGAGSRYSGIDAEFVKKELSKYDGDENVFVCAHYIKTDEQEISGIKNLRCLFRGHTHESELLDFYGKPLFDIGGYGYNGVRLESGKYTFNIFFESCAWGYNILEIEEKTASVYHRRVNMTYNAENGVFNVSEEISDRKTIDLNK